MIKTARIRQKLTQKEVAKKCKMSRSYVSKLESRKNKIYNTTLKKVVKIADELHLAPQELATWLLNKNFKSE